MPTPPVPELPTGLHLLLPFAASLSEPCQQALPRLDDAARFPHLHRLLDRLSEHERLPGDEYALSMPHERALGNALGWGAHADGCLPWAAWQAREVGIEVGDRPWGLLTPCHWLMGRETLTLLDPAELALTEDESRTLLDTLRPWFEEEGWTLVYGAPTRWWASHPSLQGLPTASLDRVIGRNPDVWMPDHPQARLIRRLQNEVQMLMYQEPLNERREAAGALPVNSFWLSGCGELPPDTPRQPPLRLVEDLRTPLLSTDMADWLDAWQALDNGCLREAWRALEGGQRVALTLCGERHALTLRAPDRSSLSAKLTTGLRRLAGRPAPLPSALLAAV